MKVSSLISSLLFSTVLACNHENIARRAEGNETLPFKYIQGNDSQADPATKGYFINHISLLVSDVNRSRKWYSEVLGMRHVFTFELTPEYTVMYMAHSQGGKNGTGYQTGAEMVRDKNNMAGMVEFQQYTRESNRTYDYTSTRTTFSHLGLIVDDIAATQTRFESLGVRIIKKAGELDLSGDTEESRIMGGAWGFPDLKSVQDDVAKAMPALEVMGFKEFMVVADPDGNLLEVQALIPTGI